MNQSPLHAFHVQQGAKLIDFAGWSMPLTYRGIIEEHRHTRKACSLFDVSHMGRIHITGAEAENLLQLVCTRDLSGMTPGLSRYTHICREDGGILDDVIVSCYEDRFLMICNASNHKKIVAWLNKHAAGKDVAIDDQTSQTAMVALQGPAALAQIQKILNTDLSDLKNYHFKSQVYVTFRYSIFRSGYTGEDGVELILPVNLIRLALPAIIGLGDEPDPIVKPAGLGARDSLRLEAGMPLYGHELTEEWDSLSAGQDWCVHLDRKDFIGAAAMRKLRDRGMTRRLVGLELEGRRTARQGFAVCDRDGTRIGTITSGVLSPTLGKSIAMAMVDAAHSEEGIPVSVTIGSKAVQAAVVKMPFYRRSKKL